jgi:hypothetical protein
MRSICDLIPKLILTESAYNHDSLISSSNNNLNQIIPNFEKIRNKFITDLFLRINLTTDLETINNINNACIEILENKNILEFVLSNEIILRHIFINLSINLNLEENSELSSYNYKEVLILLLNIIRNSIIENLFIPKDENKNTSFSMTSSTADNSNVNHNNDSDIDGLISIKNIKTSFLGELILEYLFKILDNFIIGDIPSPTVETTFSVSTRTLGIKRLNLIFNTLHFIFYC